VPVAPGMDVDDIDAQRGIDACARLLPLGSAVALLAGERRAQLMADPSRENCVLGTV